MADLHAAFDLTLFSDIKKLTMFPDYRVPQILAELGVLQYSTDLKASIDAKEEIPHSDPREIEIRAATVKVVEEIAEESGRPSIEIDWILWQMGEEQLASLAPHHRTLSIFY